MPFSAIATEWQAVGDVAMSAIFVRTKIDGKRMVGDCSSCASASLPDDLVREDRPGLGWM